MKEDERIRVKVKVDKPRTRGRYCLAAAIAIALTVVIDAVTGRLGEHTGIYSMGILAGVIWSAVIREW